jgi:hypothetical protein
MPSRWRSSISFLANWAIAPIRVRRLVAVECRYSDRGCGAQHHLLDRRHDGQQARGSALNRSISSADVMLSRPPVLRRRLQGF